ncbi:MAG: hypothetical protein ABEH80_07555 [Halobaculum sp.]
MRLGRREALRAGVLTTALLGGCVGADPEQSGGRRTTDGQLATDTPSEGSPAGSPAGTPIETESPGAPTATETPEPNTGLAERTERVQSEFVWLATEYEDAIDQFQSAMTQIRELATDLQSESEVSLGEAQRLRSQVETQVDTAEDALAPHFGVHNLIRRRTRSFTGTVVRFARRGDDDRVREELSRLANYIDGFTTDLFAAESLSRQPINNILVRYARNGSYDPDAPLLFQLRDADTGFDAFAFETTPEAPTPYTLSRPAVSTADQREIFRVFAPLRVQRSRTRQLIVSFTEGNPDSDSVFGSSSPSVGSNRTVYVQAYESAEAARRAALVAAGRTGTDEFATRPTPVGDSQWDRVYYAFDGDVLYVYLTRAGRFLFATGATRVAWEERVDWGAVHERTWLGGS